ncbi:MAG TPA: hypothetical protein VLE99_01165 [Candidatus Saccharimonadales bacterium]|nr:hypothetical protein [Candidatus Saccharimonadales bacterium]
MKNTDQTGFSIVEALLILVVVGILGFTGWYVYHAKQASDKTYSATSNSETSSTTKQAKALHGTKTVSLDATYEKYTNYDTGVSLTYSKMVANAAECTGTTPQTASVPVKVYEDTAKGKVYVAASKHAVTVAHQISPGAYQGNDSCTVENSVLSDIENPVRTLPNNNWILASEFDYAKVTDATGLDAFVAAHAPEGIVIDRSIAPSQSDGVSTYKLKEIKETEDVPASGGWYFLKYNPSKKVAVFWRKLGVQAPAWADVDSSGGVIDLNEPTADL